MEEIPVVFATPRWLRVLNVVAVATSLAACTSAIFMHLMNPRAWTWGLVAGLPTLFTATLWAVSLRWQKTTRGGTRWGWLASIPLAALNGALAGGAYIAMDTNAFEPEAVERGVNLGAFVGGAFLGGTFGILFWGPALVAVLVVFGIPIARAQRMAKLGLAGEERGEILVGALSALVGALALVVAHTTSPSEYMPHLWGLGAFAGHVALHLMSASSIIAGLAAGLLALAREARRRKFVARVEASEVPGFRVAPSTLGKVLLRVAPVPTYRVSDVGEELFEIDESGNVGHALHGSSRSQSA